MGSAALFSTHWPLKPTNSLGAFGGHFPNSPEPSYLHCKDEALVTRHLPSTAKCSHLHIPHWVRIQGWQQQPGHLHLLKNQ